MLRGKVLLSVVKALLMVLCCFLEVFIGKHSRSQPGLSMRSIDFNRTLTTVTYSKTIALHVNYTCTNQITSLGHFRVAPSLCFKAKLRANPLMGVNTKIICYFHAHKTYFHKKGFALSFVLKVRVFGTQKWPIKPCFLYVYVICILTLAEILTHFS